MRFGITLPDFSAWEKEANDSIRRAAMTGLEEGTAYAKDEFRDQVRRAGLGNRLANTVQSSVKAQSRADGQPIGYVFSKAPEIVHSYATGAVIRPVNGAHYLWIPTDNVPPARARVGRTGRKLKGGRMSPEEVEDYFNNSFTMIRSRRGNLVAWIEVIRSKSKRGFRPATKGRKAQKRNAFLLPMFTLVRSVRKPKVLDLDSIERRATDLAARIIERAING